MKTLRPTLLCVIACLGVLSIAISVFAASDDAAYLTAKACYSKLNSEGQKPKNDASWKNCATLFEEVARTHPKSDVSPKALYSAGKIYLEAWAQFKEDSNVDAALKVFNELVQGYPQNSLADDALYQIGRLRHNPLKQDDRAQVAYNYIIERYPSGDMVTKAKAELALLAASPMPIGESKVKEEEKVASEAGPRNIAVLERVEVDEAKDETIVTLALNAHASYSAEFIEQGLRTKSPPLLNLLLPFTRPGPRLAKEIAVSSPEVTRVVVHKSLLGGGARLTFQMSKGADYVINNKGNHIVVRFKHGARIQPPAETKTTKDRKALNVPKKNDTFAIVVDPGHGGTDVGAVGPTGVLEKDVTLLLSKKIANQLREEMDAKVFLTRTHDETLTLEDRNAIAVSKKADLFISVHANASTNRKMAGIETYYLNNASDEAAARLARRENRSARKKMSKVEHILSTMLQNHDAAESQLLARDVQSSLMARMGKRYPGVKNRSVRSALFYVLVGAKCPAILVESSFISNPKEEKRLTNRSYQADLAASITDGIRKYMKTSDKRMVQL